MPKLMAFVQVSRTCGFVPVAYEVEDLKRYVGRVVLVESFVLRPGLATWTMELDEDAARAVLNAARQNGISIVSYIRNRKVAEEIAARLDVPVALSRQEYMPQMSDLALVFEIGSGMKIYAVHYA